MLINQKYGLEVSVVIIFNRTMGFDIRRLLFSSVRKNRCQINLAMLVPEKKLTSSGNLSTNGWFGRT